MTLVEALALVPPGFFVRLEPLATHVEVTVYQIETDRYQIVAGMQLPAFTFEHDIAEMLRAYFAPEPTACPLTPKGPAS